MTERTASYAVFLFPQALEALGEPIKPYLLDGAGGPHIVCAEVDTSGPLFGMTLKGTDANGQPSELEIMLRNESTGTASLLAEPRTCSGIGFDLCGDYDAWIFGSARHLGEGADGNWTLQVRDANPGSTGMLISWKLTFYGT